jgi:serine/threonine-protein kinase
MSPEQVRREPLSAQTDLFSAGVLMWEMLTGRRLFHRADQDATLAAVLHEPIARPSSVRPEVPPRLDDVVMRALERDASARWHGAGDMLAAINKYLYSLDTIPGPRDVAALVAKYCPPETRRLPTHVEAANAAEAEPEPRPGGPATAVIPRGGPATAVIPRDAAPQGRPQRQRSFATNVDLAPLLADADSEDAPIPRPPPPPLPVPGRNPPSMAMLFVMAIGMIVLGGITVYVFFRGREAVLLSGRDAAIDVANMPTDADVEIDAPPPPADAQMPLDAAPPPVDASVRHVEAVIRPDAHVIDAAVAAPATAMLKVGADPWGDIYVDGKSMGRTPRELTVAAGHHTVEIVFPAETPPRKQTFAVDLGTGETKPLQADFRN